MCTLSMISLRLRFDSLEFLPPFIDRRHALANVRSTLGLGERGESKANLDKLSTDGPHGHAALPGKKFGGGAREY